MPAADHKGVLAKSSNPLNMFASNPVTIENILAFPRSHQRPADAAKARSIKSYAFANVL